MTQERPDSYEGDVLTDAAESGSVAWWYDPIVDPDQEAPLAPMDSAVELDPA